MSVDKGYFEDVPVHEDLAVHTVILDRFGFIVAVNERWRAASIAGRPILSHQERPLPNHGVGENYLRLCAFADPLSPRLITGISQILGGRSDCFSILYPAMGPGRRWILLLALPHATAECRAAILHIDVTAVVSLLATSRGDAATVGGETSSDAATFATLDAFRPEMRADERNTFASGGFGPFDLGAAATLERTLVAALTRRYDDAAPVHAAMPAPAPSEPERQPTLSKRQWEVLGLMTAGLTNIEIARRLGLSPNTVKIHVSGILARLGLPSRTQAVHWALTKGRAEKQL